MARREDIQRFAITKARTLRSRRTSQITDIRIVLPINTGKGAPRHNRHPFSKRRHDFGVTTILVIKPHAFWKPVLRQHPQIRHQHHHPVGTVNLLRSATRHRLQKRQRKRRPQSTENSPARNSGRTNPGSVNVVRFRFILHCDCYLFRNSSDITSCSITVRSR